MPRSDDFFLYLEIANRSQNIGKLQLSNTLRDGRGIFSKWKWATVRKMLETPDLDEMRSVFDNVRLNVFNLSWDFHDKFDIIFTSLSWPGDSKGDLLVFESNYHLPACLPHTAEASHGGGFTLLLSMLNVKQRSCKYQLLWSLVWPDRESNPNLPFQQ